MWAFLHKLSSPPYFYSFAGRLIPYVGWTCAVLLLIGLYQALIVAPVDYQQGHSYRIMFVHVPAAWMGMFIYAFMAVSAAIGIIWKIKLADIMAACAAPIGASFALLALATGSLWGKPMWGTWWAWDARLTSTLIMFFLYLGIIALNSAIEDKRNAARASGILAIVGAVNLPIIKFSVDWWNSLHQGSTISILKMKSNIDISMLIPLLIMAIAFKLFFVLVLLMRARNEVLEREKNSKWVESLLLTPVTLTTASNPSVVKE
ncbi:heme ABC transporter permease [Beggiatoa leptomitoformis]|uniref:Heme exporter protein C n=2 Tax=Beggiatoa leptomitoformis TaxID=288004 RepID=A0A2N9YHZ1_9GAMM|nr:heme ABC transporter permease [Beggiatoa leptomitoformis]AUI70019.1 heme ABC transporter permease [Beggiatoa leptomitoformis]